MSIQPITVRVFGSLQPFRKERGLPCSCEVEVPAEGIAASELAEQLEIPAEKIEGVFVNHTVRGLDVWVDPGDRVAFVPFDTPGPHRVFLGLYDAGKDSEGSALG
jgi:molybdopterin converting factor small subunit